MFKKTILGALALALVSAPSFADVPTRKSLQVLNDVAAQVRQYTRFTIFDDVNVAVDNGMVTLTGRVTMPFKKDDLEARVAKVDGVVQVKNELGVLPVSPYDDELRFRIARAIYSNPSFWNYAAMANPPIHIVVENGRVTLTGTVNNNVERMLARSLAMTFGAFSVSNNLRTDAEVQAMLEHVN